MYKEIVDQYLIDNNQSDLTRYKLVDNGQGVEIKNWLYEIDPPVLDHELIKIETAKTNKKIEIETARDAAIYAPITISTENEGEKTFSAFIGMAGQVALAITNLDKRIADGEISPTIRHPAQDNSRPLLTINDFRLLETELIARNDYYNQGIDLKAQVDACSTIEQVNSIDISFGV